MYLIKFQFCFEGVVQRKLRFENNACCLRDTRNLTFIVHLQYCTEQVFALADSDASNAIEYRVFNLNTKIHQFRFILGA